MQITDLETRIKTMAIAALDAIAALEAKGKLTSNDRADIRDHSQRVQTLIEALGLNLDDYATDADLRAALTETTPTREPPTQPGDYIPFEQVQKGMCLTFHTADNGFGGSGRTIERTGEVIKVTDKTVIVGGVRDLRGPEHGRTSTHTARLRRRDWHPRWPRLAAPAA